MKIKNISPIERHVEKLVFAVAAAASLYLVYSTLSSPTTVDDKVTPGGGPVGASEVENKVADAIKKLKTAQINTQQKALPTIKVQGEDFVQRYKLSQSEPLPDALLKPVAIFAPRNFEPKGIGGMERPQNQGVARVPVPPAPTDMTLTSDRKVVMIPLNRDATAVPGANPNPNPNEPIQTENKDMNWVLVEAKYPMADLVKEIRGAGLPAQTQRVTFTTVQVERKDLTAGGDWEPATPTSAVHIQSVDFSVVPDDKILEILNWYDSRIEDILNPKFFEPAPVATPTPPTPRTPAPAQNPNPPQFPPPEFGGPGGDMPPDMAGPGGPGGPGGGPGGRPRTAKNAPIFNRAKPTTPPARTPTPTPTPTPMPGGMPIGPDGMPLRDPAMLAQPGQPAPTDPRSQETVTIRFYDEHVQPNHEYAYRMRVGVFNPTYHQQIQLKDDPKAVDRPVIYSAWAEARDANGKLASIKIDPNMFLFVGRPIASSSDNATAQVSIYKWDSGAWQKWDETVVPGQPIGHKHIVAGSKEVDFSTDYTLVDVRSIRVDRDESTMAILQSTGGELTVRNSAADRDNPKRQELERLIAPQKSAPKPATPGA